MTADQAFAAYEAVRHRLPPADGSGACLRVPDMGAIAEQFDVFLLDAFGVLNIGEAAIPGAVDRIAGLQAAGKRCLVVTNAAGYPHAVLMARYARLGFAFDPEDVLSSRKALVAGLRGQHRKRWGMMASAGRGLGPEDGLDAVYLAEDPEAYDAVDAFLLLGSAEWTETRQARLERALRDRPRPVWVGNPDIVAPRESGFSIEPGHFAHRLADHTGTRPVFFGKPFGNIFELAFDRLGPGIDLSRVVMVGDSLHTDILGAQTAGVASALIAGHGFFAGHDIARAIDRAGIAPDFIVDTP